ncbi:ethanolamine utilization protein EutS [Enterococcus sp. PF1-24]|uniref:BMC domain-containing protein n=1 Tax=unclassified Enterococcus TaxID=2608891 RepID=UPI002474D6EE|nr:MULTISPECIES: BMC domain-containing protein [unclassified Enterococcus]MDH6365602.1 ethanolamine utilization protein EutS [Enterococcus sp. PFB1-1]MDH6402704.1 ethanolamine utilization protein EutS [Enterococcus sp. PF1-24]
MSSRRNIERTIQEYVPGKQVTLAHLIPNADREVFEKLGLSEAGNAIGILTITPSEASIIGADIARKSGDVSIGFMDRFSGAVVITGEVSSVEFAIAQVIQTLENVLEFDVPEITRT